MLAWGLNSDFTFEWLPLQSFLSFFSFFFFWILLPFFLKIHLIHAILAAQGEKIERGGVRKLSCRESFVLWQADTRTLLCSQKLHDWAGTVERETCKKIKKMQKKVKKNQNQKSKKNAVKLHDWAGTVEGETWSEKYRLYLIG